MLRFTSLGSGSRGNATVVGCDDSLILVDSGYSATELVRRLRLRGVEPEHLQAILVTHEHSDHSQGVARLSRRYGIPVYLTAGTRAACRDQEFHHCQVINPHTAFNLGCLQIQPYPVPHDAREPCQFVFAAAGRRLGLLTDVGSITAHIIDTLHGCDALLLECNYDPEMLHNGPYPAALCRRIDGQYGHLANHQATHLLQRLQTERLQALIGMHLSEKNNSPALALQALQRGMQADAPWIRLACQDHGFDWVELA